MEIFGRLIPLWLVALVCFTAGAATAAKTTHWIMSGQMAKERLANAQAVLKQKDKVRDAERQAAADKATMEAKHAKQNEYIHGLQIANSRFIAATCGVLDKNGRRAGGLSAASAGAGAARGAPGDPGDIPLACFLSDGDLAHLGDLLARADGDRNDADLGAADAAMSRRICNGNKD